MVGQQYKSVNYQLLYCRSGQQPTHQAGLDCVQCQVQTISISACSASAVTRLSLSSLYDLSADSWHEDDGVGHNEVPQIRLQTKVSVNFGAQHFYDDPGTRSTSHQSNEAEDHCHFGLWPCWSIDHLAHEQPLLRLFRATACYFER
jgi:hypothetical protein